MAPTADENTRTCAQRVRVRQPRGTRPIAPCGRAGGAEAAGRPPWSAPTCPDRTQTVSVRCVLRCRVRWVWTSSTLAASSNVSRVDHSRIGRTPTAGDAQCSLKWSACQFAIINPGGPRFK